MRLRVGLTVGDPAGIGPEIVQAALASGRLSQAAEYFVIGRPVACSLGQPTRKTAQAALDGEEIEIITPAIAELNSQSPITHHPSPTFAGPFSPDTLFHHAANGDWDGVLCMYHDQGLIPLKLHAFHEGVNVTLGLPFPRTSPDHGTAFEIAGKRIARPDSMIAAINLAVELASKPSRS